MLDLRYIRDNIEFLEQMLKNRGTEANLNEFEQFDAERREILTKVEALKHTRNNESQEIGKLMREGKKEEAETIKAEMGGVSSEIKTLDARLNELDEKLRYFQMTIPNVYHESTPVGSDEEANLLVRSWGEPKKFDFTPKPHYELGEDLGILDFERGAKLGGSRFTIYRGAGARLERALINFMLDLHTTEHGYTEHITPYIVKREICEGTGQLPKFENHLR